MGHPRGHEERKVYLSNKPSMADHPRMGGDHMTEEASGRGTINAFKLKSSPHKKRATFTDHVTASVRPGRGNTPYRRVAVDRVFPNI